MSKTLLIVEESLRDLKAHWFEYLQTITQAAQSYGYQVDVACHRHAVPEVRSYFNSFPIFRHARYLDNSLSKLPGERYYGFILHSVRMLQVLWPWLYKRDRYEHIFVPTVLIHHLLAWWFIMCLHPARPQHLTLFFVAHPGIWDASQQKGILSSSPMLIIQRFLLGLFRSLIHQGQVTFGVETEGAKSEFETLTDLPFRLFPHPVPPLNPASVEKSDLELLRFACYGFARYEKGTDLLKAALQSKDFEKSHAVEFWVQWVDPFSLPDGTICNPKDLQSLPHVQIIERPLLSHEYQNLLQKTHCMILPYRNNAYYARVSRVAIEAVCLGVPVIYTKGSWLEEVVTQYGTGIGIQDESVDDLVNAILIMTSQYETFHKQAIARREKAQLYFSGAKFCNLLFLTSQHSDPGRAPMIEEPAKHKPGNSSVSSTRNT